MTDHGTDRAFRAGCACTLCTAAHKIQRTLDKANHPRTPRKAPTPAPEPPPQPVEDWHGTRRGYGDYGCRCSPCRIAERTYRRKMQKHRVANGGEPPQPGLRLPIFLPLLPSRAWVDDALCAQADPEAFFPEKGGSTRPAKRVCMRCPVREPCLEDALSREERYGIWGGLSERERRKLAGNTCNHCRTPIGPGLRYCEPCGTATTADVKARSYARRKVSAA